MPKRFFLATFLLLIISFSAHSQKKVLKISRISEPISIDGKFNEVSWQTADEAKNFSMLEPDNGVEIPENKAASVSVLYDNEAIYIRAILKDNEPEKILKEITQRDDFGTADLFGVYINGYNDGQQDFRFLVSAAGVQMDCVATEDGEDYSWDGIWSSAVEVDADGWHVEMRIPYAALRFSKEEIQTWGINFFREIKRDRQKYTWNPVNLQLGNLVSQTGQLEGIKNIKPPTRLFFIPYSSYYYENNTATSSNTFKAGMDIKYGINDSFTLDAILVPDFGQTVYDNVELNLGPFEQEFNENRPFFTEGTDLFNKGELLYSRRIGGSPSTYATTPNENSDVENPTSVNLINAVKVSGRTKSGLGIGILNAITEKTFAKMYDRITNKTAQIEVEPLTNYNVLVIDQRFNQNSSVTFVNTNVTRNGNFRDANVSAFVYDLNTKNNRFNLSGDVKYSYINSFGTEPNQNGLNSTISIGKKGGKWRYNAGLTYVSKDYDPNDLGINFITDYHGAFSQVSYRILNPTQIFNSFKITNRTNFEIQNTSGRLQEAQLNTDLQFSTLKNDFFGLEFYINPLKAADFYEARVHDLFVTLPQKVFTSIYLSSNYNRKFAIDVKPYVTFFNEKNRVSYGLEISPRYRFSDRLLVVYELEMFRQNSDKGFASFDNVNQVVFSNRDRQTVTNELSAKYAISPKMTVNLATRYYWAISENRKYLSLQNDGSLVPNPTFTEKTNINYNALNFDLSYSWWFAPGSEISVLYRNNGSNYSNLVDRNIGSNFENSINSNLNTIFSISIRYFIDYNAVKNVFSAS